MTVSTIKEELTRFIEQLPDDSSYDEIVRELAFRLMIQRGLKDSDEGCVISNEEIQHRIQTMKSQPRHSGNLL